MAYSFSGELLRKTGSVITPNYTAACAAVQVADSIVNVTECLLNIPFMQNQMN